jgi:hypothetical protein
LHHTARRGELARETNGSACHSRKRENDEW